MGRAMRSAWRALSLIDGMMEGPSAFAADDEPRAFWVAGKQVANLYDRERLELRLTKPVIRQHRDRLRAEPRVELRRNPSDWLTVQVRSAPDVGLAAELGGLAADAHRSSTHDGPPVPEGADMARRRRFH